jgi:oxidase EvaA
MCGRARNNIGMNTERLTCIKDVLSWIAAVRERDRATVEPMSLAHSKEWTHADGAIRHATGRYFSIVGLTWREADVQHRQCFIEQREIGTLGFIARRGDDDVELLVHAKSEPGNIGIVQFAPTCQATESNLDCVHGGDAPPYSASFRNYAGKVVSNSLQSEHGSRFAGKLNRNIVIVHDQAQVEDDQHRWMPFRLFSHLMAQDFLVNTDARSVLWTTNWVGLLGREPFQTSDPFASELYASFQAPVRGNKMAQVASALSDLRRAAPGVEFCALEMMPGWRYDPENAVTITDGRMSIRHIRVHAETRETHDWDQPIFDCHFEQIIDLYCGREKGIIQFCLRPHWEPGLRSGAELAPTRISATENSADGDIRLRVRQSEEGGRFFQDVATYRIIDVGTARAEKDALWLTLSEIIAISHRGLLNNEARSALSLLLSLA